jgi:hypothetical protein
MIKNVGNMTRFEKRLNQEEFHLVLIAADKALTAEIFQIYLVQVEIFFQHYLAELGSAMAQICKLKLQLDLKNQFMAPN